MTASLTNYDDWKLRAGEDPGIYDDSDEYVEWSPDIDDDDCQEE
jgi:hypothetical protein